MSSVRIALVVLALPASISLPAITAAQESGTVYDTPVVAFDGKHRFERTLDLDGDGYADAFGWYPVDNYYSKLAVRGYLNDRSGRLDESWSLTLSGDFDLFEDSASAVGDFDADGSEDFAFGAQSTVFAFRSNGASAPTQLLKTSFLGRVRGMAAAELTDDAWVDLAVLRDGGFLQPRVIDVYENLGGTGFALASSLDSTDGADFLTAFDADGDGDADLVTNDGGSLSFFHASAGTFSAPSAIAHGMALTPMPAVGDVDGDGDEDVVVFGKTEYVLVRRTGPAAWSVERPVVGGPATGLADVDGDGDKDGVCCGSGGPTSVFNKANSKFEIAINDGAGGFAPSFQIQGLGSHHLAGAVDLDHDGDTDLVAGRCVYYSRGEIGEPPMPDLGLPPSSAGPSPRGMWDCEDDGDPDYVAGVGPQHVNLGDGRSSLAAGPVTGTPAGLDYVGPGFHGDFDGDGLEDLVVSGIFGGSFLSMSLLAGNGGGGYEHAGPAGPLGVNFNQGTCLLCDPLYPDDPRLGHVADLDGDGDLDLATMTPVDYTAGTTKLWRNDGSGTFADWTDFGGYCLKAVADVDGDGIDDLWVASSYEQGYLPGLGGGDYGSFVFASAGDGVTYQDEIVVRDLDGDGDVDVASFDEISIYRAAPIVMWNDGTGSFAVESLLPLLQMPALTSYAEEPRRVFADDVDADGRLDLVWAPVLYNNWPEKVGTVGVVRRSAGGGSWLPAYYQIGDPTALADVDGDGDTDLVSHAIGFATQFSPPSAGSRVQYGTGSRGTGGMVPTLGARGPFRVGESVEMRLRGAVGGGPSVLVVGLAQASLTAWPVADTTTLVDVFGGTIWLFEQAGTGTPGAAGAGGFTIPFTVGPLLAAQPWYHQAFTLDLGDPELLVSSNGLELVYGP